MMVEGGALAALCETCEHEGAKLRGGVAVLVEQVVRTFGNIAVHDGMASALLAHGCLDLIIRKLEGANAPLLECALSTLSNFAELPEAALLIAQRGLQQVLLACSSGVTRVSMHAGWLACQLASDSDAAALLLEDPEGLKALLAHACRRKPAAREEAAWALATLSASPSQARMLAACADGLNVLLELLGSEVLAISLQAAWALANLALQPCARVRLGMLEGSVHALLDAAQRKGEPLLARQSLRCLGSLLSEADARCSLCRQTSALEVLLDLSEEENAEVSNAAVRALAHACQRPFSSAARLASTSGALGTLLFLLASKNASTQSEAASCVANIAYTASHQEAGQLSQPTSPPLFLEQQKITASEALAPFIEPLVGLLDSSSKRTQAQAAVALCNISSIADCKMPIIQAGALRSLLGVAGSSHLGAQEASQRALNAVTTALTPNSRRVYLRRQGSSGRLGKAANRISPLAKDGFEEKTPRATASRLTHSPLWAEPAAEPNLTKVSISAWRSPLGGSLAAAGSSRSRRSDK